MADQAFDKDRAESKGRTRDAAETRKRMLAAAQKHFSQAGYAHVGLRDIAADAQADVSLISRYFGSKEALFEEALSATIDTTQMWSRPRAEFAANVVALFVEESERALNPLAMFMLTASDPVARAVVLTLIEEKILPPMTAWLAGKNAEARAAQILALCAGFYTYRVMLPLKTFGGAVEAPTKAWLIGAIQAIVDETEG